MEALAQNQGHLYAFSKESFKINASKRRSHKRNNKEDIILTLIADDHPYLIHGVETDLNKDPKIKIVGTASNYDELLEKAGELQPDIILMDLRMPGKDKQDLKHFLTGLKALGKSKVIIFSNETGWARIHKCLDIGANAYIEKAVSIGRLPELIRRVQFDEEVVIFTAEELPEIEFSPRQKEILHLIADGKENNEIALIIDIEMKTVQSYVNEIKGRLSEAFGIHPIRSRTLLILASKLGFGTKVV